MYLIATMYISLAYIELKMMVDERGEVEGGEAAAAGGGA